jgi:hypothetical protein
MDKPSLSRGGYSKFGAKLTVERTGCGRHFYITIDKGNLPKRMQGMYTRAQYAQQDIEVYMASVCNDPEEKRQIMDAKKASDALEAKVKEELTKSEAE